MVIFYCYMCGEGMEAPASLKGEILACPKFGHDNMVPLEATDVIPPIPAQTFISPPSIPSQSYTSDTSLKTCENCECKIGMLESYHKYRGHTVCDKCYHKLNQDSVTSSPDSTYQPPPSHYERGQKKTLEWFLHNSFYPFIITNSRSLPRPIYFKGDITNCLWFACSTFCINYNVRMCRAFSSGKEPVNAGGRAWNNCNYYFHSICFNYYFIMRK